MYRTTNTSSTTFVGGSSSSSQQHITSTAASSTPSSTSQRRFPNFQGAAACGVGGKRWQQIKLCLKTNNKKRRGGGTTTTTATAAINPNNKTTLPQPASCDHDDHYADSGVVPQRDTDNSINTKEEETGGCYTVSSSQDDGLGRLCLEVEQEEAATAAIIKIQSFIRMCQQQQQQRQPDQGVDATAAAASSSCSKTCDGHDDHQKGQDRRSIIHQKPPRPTMSSSSSSSATTAPPKPTTTSTAAAAFKNPARVSTAGCSTAVAEQQHQQHHVDVNNNNNRRSLLERQCSEITMSDWSTEDSYGSHDQYHHQRDRRSRCRHRHDRRREQLQQRHQQQNQQECQQPITTTIGRPVPTTTTGRLYPKQRSRRWKSIPQRSTHHHKDDTWGSFDSLDECWASDYSSYHDDDGEEQQRPADPPRFDDGPVSSDEVAVATSLSKDKGAAPAGRRPAMMESSSSSPALLLNDDGDDDIRRRRQLLRQQLQMCLKPPLRNVSHHENAASTVEQTPEVAPTPHDHRSAHDADDFCRDVVVVENLNDTSCCPPPTILHRGSSNSFAADDEILSSEDIRITAMSGHSSYSSYFGTTTTVASEERRTTTFVFQPIRTQRPTRRLSPDACGPVSDRWSSRCSMPNRANLHDDDDDDESSLQDEEILNDVAGTTTDQNNRSWVLQQRTVKQPTSPVQVESKSPRSRWDDSDVSIDKMNSLLGEGHVSHSSFFANDAMTTTGDAPIRVPPRKLSPYPYVRSIIDDDSQRKKPEMSCHAALRVPQRKVSITNERSELSCHAALRVPQRKVSICASSRPEPEGRRREVMDEDVGPTSSTRSNTVPAPPPPSSDPVSSSTANFEAEEEEDLLLPTIRPCMSPAHDACDRPKKPERTISTEPQGQQQQKTSPKSVMDIMSGRTQRRNIQRQYITHHIIPLVDDDNGVRGGGEPDVPEN